MFAKSFQFTPGLVSFLQLWGPTGKAFSHHQAAKPRPKWLCVGKIGEGNVSHRGVACIFDVILFFTLDFCIEAGFKSFQTTNVTTIGST